MTCEEVLARLGDFVDGELGEAELQEVELHLAACPACTRQARDLRALVARAAGLPRDLAPEHDLWPGIAERIRASRPVVHTRAPGPWAWPALAAAALVVLALVLWRGGERVPPSPSPAPGDGARFVSLAIEEDYERAAAELLATLEAQREGLTPEARARVDENLRIITEALAAIRSELAKDPGSPALNHLLMAVHQRRIEVLRTLARLTA